MKEIKKVVLAYSGGLDTSVLIPWLKEHYNNCEVIAVSGNVGQADELEGLEKKAKATGASKLYVEDLTEEFVNDYIIPTMQAGAVYEDGYLLGTSFARPLIAKRLVEIAKKEKADAIVHGCTGKGNDQVRFELAIRHFAPEMTIIAPWRFWELKSREDEIAYAEAHKIPLKISRETNYSKDKNLWHLSHEGLDLEDPGNEPMYEKEGFLEMGVSPMQAPDEPTYVTLDFEQGVPVALDGEALSPKEIVLKLNDIGGKNGIGLVDLVENRLVGMKSRGVYETPGGAILYRAHQVLETITLDKDTAHYKQQVAIKFADLVYDGQWFTPLREALSAFVTSTQQHVTGTVRLKLYKGNMINAGVWSPYTLYDDAIASFGEEDSIYHQADSEGFIKLFGLPITVQALMDERRAAAVRTGKAAKKEAAKKAPVKAAKTVAKKVGETAVKATKATKQAAAAVGQCELMYMYDKLFTEYNHTVAQVLLTAADIEDKMRRHNVETTLQRLLQLGAIPVINENDTVSTAEIAEVSTLGDNDTLASIVAVSVEADLLVLLSDIEGLYTADPHKDPNAVLIREVAAITPDIEALAGGAGSGQGTGGMVTKLRAARRVTQQGIPMVIANGADPLCLYDIVEGKPVGTRFLGNAQA